MKENKWFGIVVVCFLLIVIIFSVISMSHYTDSHSLGQGPQLYYIPGRLYAETVDYNHIVEDAYGRQWEVSGYTFNPGDSLLFEIDDNGTPEDKEDDRLVDIYLRKVSVIPEKTS